MTSSATHANKCCIDIVNVWEVASKWFLRTLVKAKIIRHKFLFLFCYLIVGGQL